MKEDIYQAITPCEEMSLSEKEQSEFENAENCYVCAARFSLDKENLKNRDHCHKTGFVPPYTYPDFKYMFLEFTAELRAQPVI